MQLAQPEERLDRFWGRVDCRQNIRIAQWLHGPRVLDVGCGYGSLTATISSQPGLSCVGVDRSERDLGIARTRFPGNEFVQADAAELPFGDGKFGTVVLRDALHHLVAEGHWPQISAELLRVCQPRGRFVFFDPNVNALLRFARRLARHEDEECEVEQAREIARQLSCVVTHEEFMVLFSLPLSGGYVGPELVPNRPRVHAAVLRLEQRAEWLVNQLRLGRHLAWRYLIVADRFP